MKNYLLYISVLWVIITTVSCGEDRSGELVEKTQHNHWVLESMRDMYLWGDSLTEFEPGWKDFFLKPDAFIGKLTAKAAPSDKWSYVEIDTLVADVHARGHFNHINSYGFDFNIMTDPTGQTTKSYARVITVYPGSPAEEAGLRRNDFISEFDGFKVSKNNVSRLEKGLSKKLAVQRLIIEGDELTWNEGDTLRLPESRYVEDVAFPVHSVNEVGGIKIGYLMCTRLLSSPEDGEKSTNNRSSVYADRMDAIMKEMRDARVNEMVLDLRLCNYGTLDMACRMASYVVDPSCASEVFAKTIWNQRYSKNNTTLHYDSSVKNLNVGRVFVITSTYTTGAAEWMIHSLQSTMGEENVIVVGQPTSGQNVMTQEVGHNFYIHLCPAVAFVSDGNGNQEYNKLTPANVVDEFVFANLGEYGTIEEPLFNAVIDMILN